MTTDRPLKPGDIVHIEAVAVHYDTRGLRLEVGTEARTWDDLPPDEVRWHHAPEPDGDDGTAAYVAELQGERDEARQALDEIARALPPGFTEGPQQPASAVTRDVRGIVREYGVALDERDEARAKVAALEAERDVVRAAAEGGANAPVILAEEIAALREALAEARRLRKVEFNRANRNAAEMCRLINERDAVQAQANRTEIAMGEALDRVQAEVDQLRAEAKGLRALLEAAGGVTRRLGAEVDRVRPVVEAVRWFSDSLAAGHITDSAPVLAALDAYRAGQEAPEVAPSATQGHEPAADGKTDAEAPGGTTAGCTGTEACPGEFNPRCCRFVVPEWERELLDAQDNPVLAKVIAERDRIRRKLKRARKALAKIREALGDGA